MRERCRDLTDKPDCLTRAELSSRRTKRPTAESPELSTPSSRTNKHRRRTALKSVPRPALAIGACAAMMLAALVTTTSSASASPSWQLADEFSTSSPACYTTSGGTNELEINLNGTWSTPINIGASGLIEARDHVGPDEAGPAGDQQHRYRDTALRLLSPFALVSPLAQQWIVWSWEP